MPTQYGLARLDWGSTAIRGLTSLTVDPAITKTLNSGGTTLDPALRRTTGIRPLLHGRTRDVGTLLAALYDDSRVIPHIPITATGDDLIGYFQSLAHGGGRGTAGTNIKMTITKGVLVPTALSNTDKAAELSFTVYADYDGSNVPVLFETDKDLPSPYTTAATSLYRVTALKNGSSGTIINHISSLSLDFGITVGRTDEVQNLYPSGSRITGFAPRMRWQTTDCATALAASGPATGAQAGSGGLLLYLGVYSEGSPYLSTSSAITLALAAGSVWYPVGINLGEFPIQVEYDAIGKGGDTVATAPLAYATGATLPAVDVTPDLFMSGPAYDNSTAVDIVNGRIEFGLQWMPRSPVTLPWSNTCVLPSRERSITITTADPDYYATLAATNGRAVSTSFRVFLRKMVNQSEPYGDAETEHVKLNVTAGFIEPGQFGGEHGQRIEPAIVVTPVGDVVAVTTGQAIA